MTRALGTPQRGQTIPEVDRLAIGLLLTYPLLDSQPRMKDTRITLIGLQFLCLSLSLSVADIASNSREYRRRVGEEPDPAEVAGTRAGK